MTASTTTAVWCFNIQPESAALSSWRFSHKASTLTTLRDMRRRASPCVRGRKDRRSVRRRRDARTSFVLAADNLLGPDVLASADLLHHDYSVRHRMAFNRLLPRE